MGWSIVGADVVKFVRRGDARSAHKHRVVCARLTFGKRLIWSLQSVSVFDTGVARDAIASRSTVCRFQ